MSQATTESPTSRRISGTLDAFVIKHDDERPKESEYKVTSTLASLHIKPSSEMRQNIFGRWHSKMFDIEGSPAKTAHVRRNDQTLAFRSINPNQKSRATPTYDADAVATGPENKPHTFQPVLKQKTLTSFVKQTRVQPYPSKKTSAIVAATHTTPALAIV
eukprot:TRINITY_DN1998_c0_g1_i1.p1 TRINITY_DN1998_c0_g1~~TRINITY_DN1998_c0_g1_i1.p1  ORF type:complete len:174 (+),score=33.30 TRINITY_DN1998_c0_g1_i1:45-524(+)